MIGRLWRAIFGHDHDTPVIEFMPSDRFRSDPALVITMQEKRDAAITYLGDRYVFSEARRSAIKKFAAPIQERERHTILPMRRAK